MTSVRTDNAADAQHRLLSIAILAIPVVFVAAAAWSKRWMSDDGFINVRIVEQLFSGNGPVFNRGERVEAGTSPAWLFCLVVGRMLLFWLPTEWVAVVLGIVATTLAVVLAQYASARLYKTSRVIPFGILFVVVLPPMAEFATSGLETGLSLLWIAGSFWLLVEAADRPAGRTPLAAASVIGLGPLVRPDFAILSLVAGAVLLYVTRPHSRNHLAHIALAALSVPVAYEVFRMAYYGALLPNTAFAKEASAANWRQGWWYLLDATGPYRFWVAALLVAIAALMCKGHAPSRTVLIGAPIFMGLLYAALVVRFGGDFMHARVLLPAAFLIVLPVAAIPVTPKGLLLVAAAAGYALIPLTVGGPPYDGRGPHGLANERALYVRGAGRSNPVTIDDYSAHRFVQLGRAAYQRASEGSHVLFAWTPGQSALLPLRADVPYDGVLAFPAIGMAGVAAGEDVYVADLLGLASPIGSRLELGERGRPGHEKVLPLSWIIAMFTDPDVEVPPFVDSQDVRAARTALRCPDIADMLDRARDPLSMSRLVRNAVESTTTFAVRFPPDPSEAAAACAG